MKLLTDVELRAKWSNRPDEIRKIPIDKDTILTPAARDFIREHGIELCTMNSAPTYATMTRTPVTKKDGKICYRLEASGAETQEKAENMTCLYDNVLVPKTHPRIALRGKIDTMMAQLLCAQAEACAQRKTKLAGELGEVLEFLRHILAAEVRNIPLEEIRVFGLSSEEIRHRSHNVREAFGIDHPIPDYRMGAMALRLNLLRAQSREVELEALRAFTDDAGNCDRMDIIEALNRLSSCIYILFCKEVSGGYGRG